MENVLSILFCLTLFYVTVTYRVKAYVTVLQVQGLILAILMLMPFIHDFSVYAIILPTTLILVKVILILSYNKNIIVELNINRKIEPSIRLAR